MKKIYLILIVIALGIYGCYKTFWADFIDDSWNLSFNGTLTISKDYSWDGQLPYPWDYQKDKIKKIVIEDGATSIGEYAFSGCANLTSVTIPNSVTKIAGAFCNCSSLTSVTIPSSVTNMDGAFSSCTALTSITIPNSVENIDGAFNKCSKLTTVTVPNSITSIGDHTFFGCTSLKSITIPESVKNIGSEVFLGCSSLKSITCKAQNPPHCQIYSFAEIPDSLLLLVPANSIDAYKKAEGWAKFKNIQGI